MKIKQNIKKIVKFLLNNIPAKNYTLESVTLAPNELLKNKTAIITGGTSGIGFSICQAFLNAGANILITSRNSIRLRSSYSDLAKFVSNPSKRIFPLELDNRDIRQFETFLSEGLIELRKKGIENIDILVNNAGILGQKNSIPFAEDNDFDEVMNTNLKGVFFLSQTVANYMKNNGIYGNILNIGSSSSIRPAVSAYALSKWGLRGLTLGLAKCYAPYGITVNAIAPGPTATPMLLKDDKQIFKNNSPIGRYILPEEIANMAVILTSPLGRSILGDMIYMTGGAGLITLDDIDYSFYDSNS